MSAMRTSLVAAAMVLLGLGVSCIPPVAFHDGLPAWAPPESDVEWRVGWQRLAVSGADSFNVLGRHYSRPDFSVNYLTPGMRIGLRRPPRVMDVGLASAMMADRDGFSALFGATFGFGYAARNLSVMFRPSVYLVDFYSDKLDGTGVDFGYWSQASFLVGTGYRSPGWSIAAGGRASPFSAGPLAVVGVNLKPAEFRAEFSYLFPVTDYASGRVLTVGLTAAAPTRPEPDYGPGYR